MTVDHDARSTKSEKRLAAREHVQQMREENLRKQRRSRVMRIVSIVGGVLLVALLATLFISTAVSEAPTAAPDSSSARTGSVVGRTAPDFTMPDTADQTVSLASLRGESAVILYFSEGAGCEACVVQMKAIEQKQAEYSEAGFTVLPIVMNSKAQISEDAAAYAVQTPFLIDDGSASAAYGTLGKGMHANMPGHSFVVIDKSGVVRWSGEYPSMWLDPMDLLATATAAIE